MSGQQRKRIGSDDVRTLFRDAASGTVDGTDRLLARVPEAVAEARRQRARATSVTDALVPLARSWLPAVAAATVMLVAIAVFAGPGETTVVAGQDAGVDRLVLIGELGESGTEDVLLRAIVGDAGDVPRNGTEVER